MAIAAPVHALPGREELLLQRYARSRDEQLRAELVARFLPLARSVARRYSVATQSREDLEQVAALGLVKALDRFDPARGTAFSSFAVPTIAGELRRHLRDHDWGVRVPRRLYELASRAEAAARAFEQRHHRAPTLDDLARAVGADPETLVDALEALDARRPLSLEAPARSADGDGMTRGDLLPAEHDEIARCEDAVALRAALRRLPVRNRRVLLLRFFGEHSQVEIARLLGMSQMQVSRILRESLRLLATT